MKALRKTALHSYHITKLHASPMAEFAGYDMPIQYKDYGIVKESEFCRKSASMFDVSHMGQVRSGYQNPRKRQASLFGKNSGW